MKQFGIVLLLFAFLGFSQGIKFEKTSHDFGHIQEDNGPVLFEFKFTNTGDAPLKIKDVKASCDCTTPGWTMAQVDPGYNGYIKAKYDPTNRPGVFRKTLTVRYTYKGTDITQVLNITGFVDKGVNSRFPAKKGSLRADSEYFSFYSLTTKEPVNNQIKLYNGGNKPVTIIGFENLPAYYKASIVPGKLQSKDSAVLKITFDPKKKGVIGDVYDSIKVKTDDEQMPVKTFYILGTVHMYFGTMSREDSLKAPRLSIPKNTHDAGIVKEGDTIKVSYELINTGRSDLKIFSTSSSCSCTISKPESNVIKPGEKTLVNVSFNTAGKSGKNSKQVYLYTNDPANPEPRLILKSDIQGLKPEETKPDTLR